MIFVTVGTHEQPFNRLLSYIDDLIQKGIIIEDVIAQTGFSTYEPQYYKWQKLYPYSNMIEMVSKARIVITHGGPSSFIMPLQVGKIPVVVPRQKEFNEHVNSHQVVFTEAVAERQRNIIVVRDIKKLGDIIVNYEEIVATMPIELKSNNMKFCSELDSVVNKMFMTD